MRRTTAEPGAAGLQASQDKAMANSPSHADAAADGTTEFAFKATFDPAASGHDSEN